MLQRTVTHGRIDRAVKVFKTTECLCVLRVDTFTIHSTCSVVLLYYFTSNGISCSAIVEMFLSMPKSLGGITVMPITLKR